MRVDGGPAIPSERNDAGGHNDQARDVPPSARYSFGRHLRVEGQATFSTSGAGLQAALDGIELAWVPQELAADYISDGGLIECLSEWCPKYEVYHLFYPSRKQKSPAFSAFVDAMRFRV
uniref:LysR substrate-binding domain-containing protein n=1 Tax=Neorhizobium sp. EC2-8 TaxID=3129230 RepID=UPI003101B40C